MAFVLAGKPGQKFFSRRMALSLSLLLLFLLFFFFRLRNATIARQMAQEAVTRESCKHSFDLSKSEVISWEPRVFLYRNLLTDEECDYIIQKGNEQGLARSKVAASKAGDETSNVRTSYGTFLDSSGDAVLQSVEDRIAKWSRLPVTNGEPFYLLRYTEGQQYKPHHDYFHPELPGMDKYIGAAGQRTVTVLLYLATPEEGGETVFPHNNKKVPAVKGDAVLFHSHTAAYNLDPNSLHGGMPVISGTKYCATKWIRMGFYRDRVP